MTWFLVALAGYLFVQVIAFGLCWLIIRLVRNLSIGRVLLAFVLAWFSLPIVTMVLGKSPGAFQSSGLWTAAFVLNALFLFVLGKSKVIATIPPPPPSPAETKEPSPINEDR